MRLIIDYFDHLLITHNHSKMVKLTLLQRVRTPTNPLECNEQQSSLSLVPGPSSSTHSSISLSSTSNAHGLHDTLRHGGVRSLAAEVSMKHPLQSRLNDVSFTPSTDDTPLL